ncbi:MAG: CRISPR-associated protein (Cas_Cas5) [Candidatus Methanolliviera sp. GoM_oil]|nr:MAG: CRISPR-associated protein (Cas_Cas5) [Candidatus Methanolliviera sp. GoM_oil]
MEQERTIKHVLIFDIWGDYAHFRRFYTTTSPLTFPIPPRTALCGLIAAIIGKEKEYNEYLKYFALNEASIGLRLLNPVKKVMIAENLIHTKNAKGPGMNLITERTQINFEFLKDQKYRIYFHHVDEDIYQELKENLISHKSVYTPCLGLSENIANFEFIGEFKVKSETTGGYIQINSVLPTEKIAEKQGINFNLEGEYFSIRVPIELNLDRVVTKYGDIFFERTGEPVEAKLISPYWRIDHTDGTSENFLFIE